jgi:glucose dehydrogenase
MRGFSPLTQITRENVSELRLAWSWSLPGGPNEVTPLVHDGVMFGNAYGDKVQALDAATGDLLWRYAPSSTDGEAQRRAYGGAPRSHLRRASSRRHRRPRHGTNRSPTRRLDTV